MIPIDILIEITKYLIPNTGLYFDIFQVRNNPLIDPLLLNNEIFCVKSVDGITFHNEKSALIYQVDIYGVKTPEITFEYIRAMQFWLNLSTPLRYAN